MKRLCLSFLLLLCLPLAARADEASHRAKAQEVVTLLHMDSISKQLLAGVMKQSSDITTQRAGGNLSPEMQASLSDFQKKMMGFLEPQVGWKAIEPECVSLYANAFTEEELDGLIAFYKSPSGIAFIAKTPAINQQAGQILRTKIAALQPQVKQMFDDFQKSLPTTAPAPAAPAEKAPTP